MIGRYKQLSHNNYFSQDKQFDSFEERAIDLTVAQREAFYYLLGYFDRYKTNYVSQIRMGVELGYSRQTVNESVGVLSKIKFITKITRFKRTCIYHLNPFFKKVDNLKRLNYIFNPNEKPFANAFSPKIENPIRKNHASPVVKYFSLFSLFISSYIPVESKYIYNVESGSAADQVAPWVTKAAPPGFIRKQGLKILKKGSKGESMTSLIVTPALRKATERLKLTKWGQMKLSVFPEEVLLHSLHKLGRGLHVKDHFNWVLMVSKVYCEAKNIEIPWGNFYSLANIYNMPTNAPMVFQFVTDPHELVTKCHTLPVNPMPIRTEAPQEDPEEVIKSWEQWVSSDLFQKAKHVTVPVSPHVAQVISDGKIEATRVQGLYAKYPFLQEFVDQFKSRKKEEANLKPKSYSDVVMIYLKKAFKTSGG